MLEVDETFGGALYSRGERDELPVAAVAASLGCGNPTAVAELREGERVLDLGSGGGSTCCSRHAGGADRLRLRSRHDRRDAGTGTRQRRQGGCIQRRVPEGIIEDVPLADASVDVVISNCVINLSTDKRKVINEMYRVLVPGGRIGISDVVADDHLTC